MKKEFIEILKKMKGDGVKKEEAEKVFKEYQEEEKDHWFYNNEQKIISLYIETMRDIISGRMKDKRTHRKNIELEIEYEVGDIFNMNFYIGEREESNFFHPAMIVNKKADYIYVVIGTSSLDTRKAFHYKTNKGKNKKLFLVKSFESKLKDVGLTTDTVFLLDNIQAVSVQRLKRSRIIGSIKNNESIITTIEEYYKKFF